MYALNGGKYVPYDLLEAPRTYYFPCSYDYLEITDDNNVKVGQYCGDQTGNEVAVVGDYAVLTFHSDNSKQTRGFLITFDTVQLRKCNQENSTECSR